MKRKELKRNENAIKNKKRKTWKWRETAKKRLVMVTVELDIEYLDILFERRFKTRVSRTFFSLTQLRKKIFSPSWSLQRSKAKRLIKNSEVKQRFLQKDKKISLENHEFGLKPRLRVLTKDYSCQCHWYTISNHFPFFHPKNRSEQVKIHQKSCYFWIRYFSKNSVTRNNFKIICW